MKLVIREIVPIATDAVNLVFEKPEGEFKYEPGQFITVISEVEGKKIRRAYSLCSTPFEDEYPAVTVKRVDEGRMSNHINDNFKVGDEVEVMEPMGQFTTSYDESSTRNMVFFGGGSGITPLISIIRSTLIKEPQSRLSLVYANRNVDHIIFKDLLTDLTSKYAGRFQVIHVLEDDQNGFGQIVGRPSQGIVSDLVKEHGWNESEFFICGPQPMMDGVDEGLRSAGISASNIRMESFEAGKTSPKEIIAAETDDSQVTIILDGEEHLVSVPMNQGILETALDAGLDVPYSCQSGVCTACRGKCHSGDVTTDDAEGLSDEELAEGYRLLCVGKPASSEITGEIG